MHFNNIFYQETNGQCSVTSISNKNDTTHIAPSTCTYGEHFETLQHPIFSLGADDMISVEANQTSDSKYLPDNSMFKKFFCYIKLFIFICKYLLDPCKTNRNASS